MYTMPGSSDALIKKKLRVYVRKLRPRSSPLGTFREEERLLLAKRSQRRREETAVFASNDLHKQIFLANNEFYALACESSCEWCFQTSRENGRYPLLVNTFCLNFKQHESFVAKYHAESNL